MATKAEPHTTDNARNNSRFRCLTSAHRRGGARSLRRIKEKSSPFRGEDVKKPTRSVRVFKTTCSCEPTQEVLPGHDADEGAVLQDGESVDIRVVATQQL